LSSSFSLLLCVCVQHCLSLRRTLPYHPRLRIGLSLINRPAGWWVRKHSADLTGRNRSVHKRVHSLSRSLFCVISRRVRWRPKSNTERKGNKEREISGRSRLTFIYCGIYLPTPPHPTSLPSVYIMSWGAAAAGGWLYWLIQLFMHNGKARALLSCTVVYVVRSILPCYMFK
jgi:hypothetical protein